MNLIFIIIVIIALISGIISTAIALRVNRKLHPAIHQVGDNLFKVLVLSLFLLFMLTIFKLY